MTKKKKLIIFSIVIVFAAFITIAVVNSGKLSEASTKATIPVQTELASKEQIISEITVKGTVAPVKIENVYSTSMNKVDSLLVSEGDTVKAGDILISYDNKELENLKSQLEQAELNLNIQTLNYDNSLRQTKDAMNQANQAVKQLEISLDQSTRSLETAKETLEKNTKLHEAGGLSTEQLNLSKDQVTSLEEKLTLDKLSLENAISNYNSASKSYNDLLSDTESISKLQIQLQEKQIEDLKKTIADYEEAVVSPIDGTILKITVAEGDYTSVSMPVIQIGDLSTLIVEADVSEYDAVSLKVGQKVVIKNNSIAKAFNGEVTKVHPLAEMTQSGNSAVNAVKIEITILDKDNVLKPGFTVDSSITLDVKDGAIVIPILSTIKEKDAGYITYVVNEENVAEKRNIELGLLSDLYVEAIGLKEGEQVIVNPSPKIQDGSLVNPTLKTKGDELND